MSVMMTIRPALLLGATLLLAALPAAADNPLLQPAPGTNPGASPSPLEAERGRVQTDTLRNRATDPSLGLLPRDAMERRRAEEYRRDADAIDRALQGPGPVPAGPDDRALRDSLGGSSLPGTTPPPPRITHGRPPGKPSPVQSSPVPDRKPDAPGQ